MTLGDSLPPGTVNGQVIVKKDVDDGREVAIPVAAYLVAPPASHEPRRQQPAAAPKPPQLARDSAMLLAVAGLLGAFVNYHPPEATACRGSATGSAH
jgi:hypothetical protein